MVYSISFLIKASIDICYPADGALVMLEVMPIRIEDFQQRVTLQH